MAAISDVLSSALEYQRLYNELSQSPDKAFLNFKAAKSNFKKKVAFVFSHENADPKAFEKIIRRNYGDDVANKVIRWVQRWKIDSEQREYKKLEKFSEVEANYLKELYPVMGKNLIYLAYRLERINLKTSIQTFLIKFLPENLFQQLSGLEDKTLKKIEHLLKKDEPRSILEEIDAQTSSSPKEDKPPPANLAQRRVVAHRLQKNQCSKSLTDLGVSQRPPQQQLTMNLAPRRVPAQRLQKRQCSRSLIDLGVSQRPLQQQLTMNLSPRKVPAQRLQKRQRSTSLTDLGQVFKGMQKKDEIPQRLPQQQLTVANPFNEFEPPQEERVEQQERKPQRLEERRLSRNDPLSRSSPNLMSFARSLFGVD